MATYYISSAGNNANNGMTINSSWRTVAAANSVVFQPGDTLLFRRGDTFTGIGLVIQQSGTNSQPITIGSYGTGSLPILDGGGTDTTRGTTEPIVLHGSWIVVENVQVQHSAWAGIGVFGTDCVIQHCTATRNVMGIHAENGADRLKVLYCNASSNSIMFTGTSSTDDVGAIGIGLTRCTGAEIAYCTLNNNIAPSPDFMYDGAAIEIFETKNALIHHNISIDSETFCELGGFAPNSPTGNEFHNNIIVATNYASAKGIYIHGAGEFGPVYDTTVRNNTIYLTGSSSLGFGTDSSSVTFENNIVYSPNKIAFSAGNITEGHNVYFGGGTNTVRSSTGTIATSSITANPLFIAAPLNLQLQQNSPAINRGTAVNYSTDYSGNPRTHGVAPDAGAYEYTPTITSGWTLGGISLPH